MENKGIWEQMNNPNRTILKTATDEEMLKFWEDLEDRLNNPQDKDITLITGKGGFEMSFKIFKDKQKELPSELKDLLDKTQRRLWSDKPTKL